MLASSCAWQGRYCGVTQYEAVVMIHSWGLQLLESFHMILDCCSQRPSLIGFEVARSVLECQYVDEWGILTQTYIM